MTPKDISARKEVSRTRKTAKNTAKPSPRNGQALPLGDHPANTGGKPGRSGRPSKAFKAWIADVQRDPAAQNAIRAAACDPNSRNFGAAWAVITKYGILDEGQAPTMTPEQAWEIIGARLAEAARRRKAAIGS
jgi:hypothetical protein